MYPDVQTVIDIGGQDSKVVAVGPGGRPLDFAMNDKCAAGTGRFLEVMARALQLELAELGPSALRARRAANISSTCTVFAESEVITLVAEGVEREEIVAGICQAIARRVGAMARRVGIEPPVAFAPKKYMSPLANSIAAPAATLPSGRTMDACILPCIGLAVHFRPAIEDRRSSCMMPEPNGPSTVDV